MTEDTKTLPTFDELVEEFEFLGEWEDQCDYLIDLGFEVPKLSESDKTERNRVHGCQSNVWLVHDVGGSPPELTFTANSDGMFVNGLIVALSAIYNGRSPREVLEIDANGKLSQLGIDRHLSPQRKNGLFGMIERLRVAAAQSIADGEAI